MSDTVIHFHCSSCQAKLTVPAQLAGIEGPCPKCRATIRAPQPEAAEPPPTRLTQPIPDPAPSPGRTAIPPKRDSAPATTVLEKPEPAKGSIRPEPRERPERPTADAVTPRRSTADMSHQHAPVAERAKTRSNNPSMVGRLVLPLVFLLAGGGLAYILLYHFMPPTQKTATPAEPVGTPVAGSAAGPGTPVAEPPPSKPPAEPIASDTPTIPAEPEAPSPPASEPGASEASIAAQNALRDFIHASSAGARLPLIEPAYPREQLEDTVVGSPLLSATHIIPGPASRNTLEGFTDHPFHVQFEREDGDPLRVLVIVRQRDGQQPKVLVDPLLDLLGDRLADYAAAPSEEPGTFSAVIEAMPRCFETDIPNGDRKFTYKLSASAQGGELARAYAPLKSPLAEQLFSPDSPIRWGKRLPATVTLVWNTTEDPELPFLQLLEIKSLNWNP